VFFFANETTVIETNDLFALNNIIILKWTFRRIEAYRCCTNLGGPSSTN